MYMYIDYMDICVPVIVDGCNCRPEAATAFDNLASGLATLIIVCFGVLLYMCMYAHIYILHIYIYIYIHIYT